MIADFDRCYDAMLRQDARFDGWIVVGVHSTGIYCRPSCPARPPKRDNVAFHPTAAAAQRAGLRACQRCRPDATSGSPKWQIRDDLAARAMRLIADGVLDRVGLRGLAHALGTTQRHLDRLLIEEASSSAWQLARAQRAQTARTLIESTTLPFVQVANAVGFDDVSQFQATVGQIFAATPAQLRQRARPGPTPEAGQVHLNLPVRTPFAPTEVLDYLAVRAVPGVERVEAGWLHRALHLPYGGGHVSLRPWATHVDCRLDLDDVRDVAAAVYRCRHLLDLDADPEGIAGGLGGDPVLGPLIERVPGLRSPGSFDAGEILARAVVGQQVSLGAARTVLGRLAGSYGDTVRAAGSGVTRTFPSAARLAEADPAELPMPRARADTLTRVMRAVADGRLSLHHGADRLVTRARLLEQKGIGPWTASYVLMRGLGDPDVLMWGDLGLQRALTRLGGSAGDRSPPRMTENWKPWRSYATHHLWNQQASSG